MDLRRLPRTGQGTHEEQNMTPEDEEFEAIMKRQLAEQEAKKPAKRGWVGLTLDEALEISEFLNLDLPEGWIRLSNAIEAKLKEKNNG